VNVRRAVFAGVLLLTAVLLELTLLSRLGLPGATPDLVLVCVSALALVRGAEAGAVIGFGAGLLLDLAPPAVGYLGMSAFLLALVGYLAGMAAGSADRGVWRPVVLVAGLGALAVVVRAVLGGLLGDDGVVWDDVPLLVVTEAFYAGFLAVFVIPLVRAVDRRLGSPRFGPGRVGPGRMGV